MFSNNISNNRNNNYLPFYRRIVLRFAAKNLRFATTLFIDGSELNKLKILI